MGWLVDVSSEDNVIFNLNLYENEDIFVILRVIKYLKID